MRFYSDITKKIYDTEKELTDAEVEVQTAELAKKAAEEKKNAERKARAAAVDAAYKALVDARKSYNKLLTDFCKDYGSYHCSISDKEAQELLSEMDYGFYRGLSDLAKSLNIL